MNEILTQEREDDQMLAGLLGAAARFAFKVKKGRWTWDLRAAGLPAIITAGGAVSAAFYGVRHAVGLLEEEAPPRRRRRRVKKLLKAPE